MFSPHIAEKTAINIRLSIKYIIAPIMKTSIGLYHLYFSKVLGNVIYSEISLTVIWTYFYLFAYNVIGIICFMTLSKTLLIFKILFAIVIPNEISAIDSF